MANKPQHPAKARKKAAGGGGGKPLSRKPSKSSVAAREYWFVSVSKQRAVRRGQARLKFVDLDSYVIAKEKEGWLTVKDKKGKKAKRWTVFRENTLLCFEAPDAGAPLNKLDEVDGFKVEVKPKKGEAFSIKLTRGKEKLSLICDNDLMCQKWQEALMRGKSGVQRNQAPALALKAAVEVEEIPEYTEEEEMRDEGMLPSAHQDSGVYITTGSLAALARQAEGPLTPRLLSNATYGGAGGNDGTYVTVNAMEDTMVNASGQYLTMVAAQQLFRDAGYTTVGATLSELGYMSLEAATAFINKAAGADGGYATTVDAVQRAASSDTGYMSVTDMQGLAVGARGDGGYMTTAAAAAAAAAGGPADTYISVEAMAKLLASKKHGGGSGGGYMTVEQAREALSGTDVAAGYMSLADVQKQVDAGWSKFGEYLTVARMQELCSEAGYMTIADAVAAAAPPLPPRNG